MRERVTPLIRGTFYVKLYTDLIIQNYVQYYTVLYHDASQDIYSIFSISSASTIPVGLLSFHNQTIF